MWICLNDAFFSIVSKDCKPSELLVRARRGGDLEKVFNDEVLLETHKLQPVTITRYTKSDYLYRAVVPRAHINLVLAAELERVVYSNFKASTRDPDLHRCYNRMWHAHADMQELPPYSNGKPRAKATQARIDTGSDGYGLFDDEVFMPAKQVKVPVPAKAAARKTPKKLTKGR